LDRAVGVGRVRVWHLNDSKRPFGSRVDRHAGIGRGHLGLEPFRFLINDPRFHGVPMILETPKGLENGEELDAINLRILQELWNTKRTRR
jgi:deoxyribonuclease IV